VLLGFRVFPVTLVIPDLQALLGRDHKVNQAYLGIRVFLATLVTPVLRVLPVKPARPELLAWTLPPRLASGSASL
jgi:hypothetical protein